MFRKKWFRIVSSATLALLIVASTLFGLSLRVSMKPEKGFVSISAGRAYAQELAIGEVVNHTFNSKTTYLGNNRYAYRGSIGALHYKDAQGNWQDIDQAYSEADTEGFAAKFTKLSYLIRLGDDSTRRIYPNRNDLSYWIEIGKPFASMGTPTKTGGYWVWNFTNAIIAVKLGNRGAVLGFRLKNSSAPTSITLPFNSQGISRNGRYILHNGYIVGTLPKPIAIDANGVERDCIVSWSAGSVTVSLNTSGLLFPIDINYAFTLGGSPPIVEAVNGGNNNAEATSHTVNLPSGIQAGDLILVFFASDGNPTITFPSGWTANIFDTPNGTATRFTCHYRTADGTEGSTITVTTSVAERTAHTTYRISGWGGVPTVGSPATGATANPNPPSTTPPWGAKDTLWIAACGYDYKRIVSVYPSNYLNGRNDYADNVAGCGVGTATRVLNAASEDPSAFAISASDEWVAATIAIMPCGVNDPTFSVGASTDDCFVNWTSLVWGINLTSAKQQVGYSADTTFKNGGGMRFLNLNIPQSATINVAYLNFVCAFARTTTTVNSRITGNKVASPATWSTIADYKARRGTVVGGANNNFITTAQVDWDAIPAWVLGTSYQSPSIVSVIQEIANAYAITDLALWWDDHDNRSSQVASCERIGASWDNTTYNPPEIYLEWTAVPDIIVSPTTWTLNEITGSGKMSTNTTYYANPLGDTSPPSSTVLDSECRFTLTNSSAININIVVNCSNFSGGSANMTNSNTGSNGATSYGGHSWYSGMTYANKVIMKTTGSSVLWTSSTPGQDIKFGAEIKTQTNAWTGGTSSTATMTITATAS